jgi:hypothetical protein
MTDHFIQQFAEFACKYPSAIPKKKIATEMPKVAQSMMPAPMPKNDEDQYHLYHHNGVNLYVHYKLYEIGFNTTANTSSAISDTADNWTFLCLF